MKKSLLKLLIKEIMMRHTKHEQVKKEMKMLEKEGKNILNNIEKISKEEFGI